MSISPRGNDSRIAVRFGQVDDLSMGDALLIEGKALQSSHPTAVFEIGRSMGNHLSGCRCCFSRSTVGIALAGLFSGRVLGRLEYFERVLAVAHSPEGARSIKKALRHDPVAAARFRLQEE